MYRTESLEDTPREVAFSALSPETQQALIEACSGEGALLLASDRLSLVGSPGRWAALFLLCSTAFALAVLVPFGMIHRGPREITGGQGVFLGLCLGGALLSALLLARSRRLPRGGAAPGLYLFASDLVDTRGPTLQIFPASCIESVTLRWRQIHIRLAQGARFVLPREEQTPADLRGEIAALRRALGEAEARGDADARRRLDPFCRERHRWHELPPCKSALSRGRGGRAFPLVAASFAASAAAMLPLASLVEEQSDLRGVRAALGRDDFALLAGYMRHRKTDRKAYSIADTALFARARASSDNALLLDYLRLKGAFFDQACDELFARIKAADDTSLAYDFVRFGDGPRREQLDQELFDAARAAGTEVALARYAAIGRRADEIRRVHLPRARLAQAFVEKKYAQIRAIAGDPTVDQEVRDEARGNLDTAHGEARKRLAAVTGLKTPFAQALDQALEPGRAGENWFGLVVDYKTPYVPLKGDPRSRALEQLEGAFRSIFKTYIDESLLTMHLIGDPTQHRLHSAAFKLTVSDLLPSRKRPSRVEIEMQFFSPSGAISAAQTLRFEAPHPDAPLNGRDFAGVTQEMLTKALLGEPPAWP